MASTTDPLRPGLTPQTAAVAKPNLDHHSVLIVEDELSLQTTLTHVLLHLEPGMTMSWAMSFREAIEKVRQNRFDLIIADYHLLDSGTGLDLWAFCRRRCPGVPFLLMSAMGVRRYLNIIAEIQSPPAFLPKPFRLSECEQAVAGLLFDQGWTADPREDS